MQYQAQPVPAQQLTVTPRKVLKNQSNTAAVSKNIGRIVAKWRNKEACIQQEECAIKGSGIYSTREGDNERGKSVETKTSSGGSNVTFRNESRTLRHRRSFSSSIACSCAKCHIHSNLFTRSKSVNHSERKCTDCRILQKQKVMRKCPTLYIICVISVITQATPEQDVYELDNTAISGSQQDHIVYITDNSSGDPIQNHIHHHTHQLQQHVENAKIKVIGSKVKFACRLLNVFGEIGLAYLNQEDGSKELTLVISTICFVVSVVELVVEAKVSGAEWRRRGCCYWFYHTGTQAKLFGDLIVYFGVGSSGIQFIINLVTVVKKHKCVKFEPTPLLLAGAHFVCCYKDSVVRCTLHGCPLECSQCVRPHTGNEHIHPDH